MLDMATKAPAKATDTKHRELSWFSERVEKGRKAPYVEITTVTPTIAARLLEANDGNRPVSERLVAEIAADIEHGFWVLNGETIIVSKDGLLNDGQHRLEAVIRTGRSIETAVMWGVPRHSRLTVDMGKQRTAGNFLAMTGVPYCNNAAAVSKLLLMYSRGHYSTGGGKTNIMITKQDIRDYYEKNKKAIDKAVSELGNERFPKMIGITPIAAAHVTLTRINSVEAVVFFARLCDGANLKPHDPILWLRTRLMSEKKSRLNPHQKFEIILRHWNYWRRGARMSRNIPRDGFYPKVEK